MTEPFQDQVTDLYNALVESFATGDDVRELAAGIESPDSFGLWDPQLVDRLLSTVVLLDHVGAPGEAIGLLERCRGIAEEFPALPTTFRNVELAIRARNGLGRAAVEPDTGETLPGDVWARTRINQVLINRYSPTQPGIGEVSAGGSIAHFALTSLAFDRAIFAGRAEGARVVLDRLEQLAGAIMSELGEGHPYLGHVLLTIASAKCGLAAVEGNTRDLRRYAETLAIAVQRASAVLGPDHAQTIGARANLLQAEFEIALASRSPVELHQCWENLVWLEERARARLGERHPTAVVLAINAAVAELESARRARSVSRIEAAERKLGEVAGMAEERFGEFHPCAAIARSNAAAAGFDLARARGSRPGLEHMVGVLENAVTQVSESLGAGHATARALTQQLRTCRQLLGSAAGGGVGTLVRTATDEPWGLDDDYVPVYDSAPPPEELAGEDDLLGSLTRRLKQRQFTEGDVVEGAVTEVDAEKVVLDLGLGAEGVIPARELAIKRDVDPTELVAVGERIQAMVLRKEDEQGRQLLSKKRADMRQAWDEIDRLREADQPATGTVVEVVKGGLVVDVGVRGFLPSSLVETSRRVRDLKPYLGKEIQAKIIEVDRGRDQVVLSRRAWLEQSRTAVRDEFLSQLTKGQIRTGVVSSIVSFGAFVNLGGVDGLVHISELSWKQINHPSEAVEVGQEILVEVLNVDRDRRNVSLSLRATQEDPWRRFARLHQIGQVVPGTVTKLVPFGAFVRLDEDIEGLVHTSELGRSPVTAGTQVTVKIIDIDLQRRRISLSRKAVDQPR